METIKAPEPVMLRLYEGDKKGATAFFRNRIFLKTAVAQLKALGKPKVRVLFHACSGGAEPYSFAVYAAMAGLEIEIDATDIVPSFVELAKMGEYPNVAVPGMLDEEKAYLHIDDRQGIFKPRPDIMARVNFLEPASFCDFTTEKRYDAVFIMNALTYVNRNQQTVAIRKAARIADHYLFMTSFHLDTIREDIDRVDFVPVADNAAQIHAGWGDRIRLAIPDTGDDSYNWAIPPYTAQVEDKDYKFCAIFARKPA